jgi:hypothetical protein
MVDWARVCVGILNGLEGLVVVVKDSFVVVLCNSLDVVAVVRDCNWNPRCKLWRRKVGNGRDMYQERVNRSGLS